MIGISKLYCGSTERSDSLRYGHKASPLRAGTRKPVVVWNCTRRCNLSCAHCYSASNASCSSDELTTDQGKAMLDDLAGFGCPVVLFSGGEPLMRTDLIELVQHARSAGLRAVISTNGTLIDQRVADHLAQVNVDYVGVSLDGLAQTHDAFRGKDGAFDAAIRAIRLCRDAGVKTGARLTLSRRNFSEIDDIFTLLCDENIPRACFYHLVYTGRGRAMSGDDLSHQQTRNAVDRIIDNTARLFQKGMPKEILTVDNHADGPYLYMRMVKESHPRAREALKLLRRNGGDSTGVGIGCVSWNGDVHPDQFWRAKTLGNVLDPGRPFSKIWSDKTNETLNALRNKRLHIIGRCAACRWFDVCGGNFRARALFLTGDAWGYDDACYLTDEEIAPPSPRAREE